MTTDLTGAYDTVNNKILISKLKHHGISEEAAILLSSFLRDRKFFVKVQVFRSEIIKAMNLSVIQGSKLAGLLYTLYMAEVTNLDSIMKNPKLFKDITGRTLPTFKSVSHKTTNFVDDSSNVIGAGTKEEL